MNKKLSMGGVVLGILAAGLGGCADETANQPQQTKSAITSRGFVTNGCTGTGVFDITSNDLINFVAIDQSSFQNVDAQVYALDKNNQEQMIATTQNASSISNSLAEMLNQVSNYQTAAQRAEQLAIANTASYQNAYAANRSTADSMRSTRSTSSHDANSSSRQFTRTNASGFNDQESSQDVHSTADQRNNASAWQSANAAARNEILARASNFANAGQSANATNGALNAANSNRAAGTASDSSSDVSSAANNGATTSANQNAGSAALAAGGAVAAPVGWGWGGFGFAPVITNQSAFNNSDVFNSQFANASNSTRAAANNSAYANLLDRTFSNVFSNANQSSFANTGSDAVNATRSNSYANSNRGNAVSTASDLHNDQATHNAYNTGAFNEVVSGANQHLDTADAQTVISHAINANSLLSNRAASAGTRADSLTQADQLTRSDATSSSLNKASNQQYQALTNLSQYNANQLVMRLNVTANNQNAVLRIFTGNNQNNVASSQDFAQGFAGCGVGASVVVPAKGVAGVPGVLDEAVTAPLGDRVAKPE